MVKHGLSECFLKTYVSFFLLWTLFIPKQNFSQVADTANWNSAMLLPSHLKFSFVPVAYNKLNLHQQKGEQILHSRNTFSAIAGLGYYQRLEDMWGLAMMAEMTVVPQNIIIPYEIRFDTITNTAYIKDSKFPDLNEYSYTHFIYTLTASIEKAFIKNKRTCYSMAVGAKLNRLVAYPYETSFDIGVFVDTSTSYSLFKFHLNNYYQRYFVSYFIKTGVVKFIQRKRHNTDDGMLKNSSRTNIFQMRLIINYSPKQIGRGWYRFYNFGFENYGTAELGLNYIGLEFTYGLTLNQKKHLKSSKQ